MAKSRAKTTITRLSVSRGHDNRGRKRVKGLTHLGFVLFFRQSKRGRGGNKLRQELPEEIHETLACLFDKRETGNRLFIAILQAKDAESVGNRP